MYFEILNDNKNNVGEKFYSGKKVTFNEKVLYNKETPKKDLKSLFQNFLNWKKSIKPINFPCFSFPKFFETI
jgi:hypothetical protein